MSEKQMVDFIKQFYNKQYTVLRAIGLDFDKKSALASIAKLLSECNAQLAVSQAAYTGSVTEWRREASKFRRQFAAGCVVGAYTAAITLIIDEQTDSEE